MVLTEGVPDAHLAGLRQDGVSYIFAGEQELDLGLGLEILNRELGLERLLLEGGGGSNGSFLRAGLIDEISVAICPAIDGAKGAPSIFELRRQGYRYRRANPVYDPGEHRGAGGRRGLAPLSAPKPLMPTCSGFEVSAAKQSCWGRRKMAEETIRVGALRSGSSATRTCPRPLLQQAKECIIDTIAAGICGSALPWSRIVIDYAERTGPGGKCHIFGRGGPAVQAPLSGAGPMARSPMLSSSTA